MHIARIVFASLFLAGTALAAEPVLRYTEACDASAGAALSPEIFVVASDEDNALRFYRRGTGGRPVATQRLDTFLGISEEADIEAVARVGDRLYWIGSHGRNKKGKPRPARQQFFATDIKPRAAGLPQLVTAGTPYRDLLKAMIADPKLAALKLAAAEPLAPEAPGGLNIEALVPRPDGSLWIGFRNPLPGAKAILVPLLNPAELVSGSGARPSFGEPLLLDLGGRGLRSLEAAGDRVLIVAGPPADSGSFALFSWSGRAADKPTALQQPLGDLRPEAMFALPDGAFLLLSDDGGVEVGGQECKDLPDATARSFRAQVIRVEPPR